MSEYENEGSSAESEVSENPDPGVKVNEQILRLIQEIRVCRTKKLKLMTSQIADAPIPESDLLSSHKEVWKTMIDQLKNTELLQSCFMSYALLMRKNYLEQPGANRTILKHLTTISNRESNSLKLLEKRKAISQDKVELTLTYKKNLQDYHEIVEGQQVKNAEKLQTTNSEMAHEIDVIKLKIKKINIMCRTIMNMYAGAVHLIEDNDDMRNFLKEHSDTVRLEDFEYSEMEP